jgi:predicted DsbA family dithiol-disulfide isomerase
VCAALYLVSAGLLFVGWAALRRTGEGVVQALSLEAQRWRRRAGRAFGLSASALALLTLMAFSFKNLFESSSRICNAVEARAGHPVATPRLVVYVDFQCPVCARFDASLQSLNGKVDITQRHYPSDSECNPRVEHSRHPGACLQARAAICAGAQGQYDQFSDRLFETMAIGEPALLDLAASTGLDRASFQACLDSDRARRELSTSINSAIDDDVHSTPTVFVNGVRHVGALSSKDIACLNSSSQDAGVGQP